MTSRDERPRTPRGSPPPAVARPAVDRPAVDRPAGDRAAPACRALESTGPRRRRSPPQLSRPSAVLDDAHLGDIEGALGRIRLSDEDQERRGLKRKLITFLAIVGPGLIVMVGDNDAGGVSTYAQAGQNYGYTLLWTLLLLIPVLIVNQEMVVRLGAVTGVGHARLINERFGRFWGWFSVGDLFILNFLTIVTEFIGVSLALQYFHVSPYISVPIAGVLLVAITASGSFARWERSLFAFIAVSLILFPLALTSDPQLGADRLPLRRPRRPGRLHLDRGAADHRDRRHHGRALAAVLPAVQRHRQADHAAVHRLRTGRHHAGRVRRGDRGDRDPHRRRLRGAGHQPGRPLH